MKAKDIKTDGTQYAVKVPRVRYGKRDGTDIVKASVEDVIGTRVMLNAHPTREHPSVVVTLAAVLDTWDAYELDRAHTEALRMDDHRTWVMEYEAKREANAAHVRENILPAFRGLMVQPTGTSNFERDDIDMADEIERYFCTDRSGTIQVAQDWFEAIAGRIRQMQLDIERHSSVSWGEED
jgi:hypothetical protein